MKKLICLFSCLFIGAIAFSATPRNKPEKRKLESSDKVLVDIVSKYIEDPELRSKYYCLYDYDIVNITEVNREDGKLIEEYISDNYSGRTYYLYIVQSNKDYSKHYLVLCFECFDTKIYLIK